ncbi:hypothetical protein JX265_003538 [Neoarthrinium moseri]|uniref:Uncharacterized protein n=1 Tax=Neoarthrinium moseri TaxID=1658444 RepID=A0A9P9WS09_9PEZI|nr:hypothetical protein JX265_003538 [Neoarthrinium moseri]
MFAVKTMIDEVRRLGNEFETYDVEALLAATQASILYILLQAQYASYLSQDDIAFMVNTLGDMMTKLHLSTVYQSDIHRIKTLTQREWALYESIRRAANLLFVLETLLDVIIGHREVPDCPGFGAVPLPCSRDLWNYECKDAWPHRLKRDTASRTSGKTLTIGDLIKSSQSTFSSDPGDRDSGLLGEAAKWGERVDEFGSLVWMAITLN